jgi:hypothetical protein
MHSSQQDLALSIDESSKIIVSNMASMRLILRTLDLFLFNFIFRL